MGHFSGTEDYELIVDVFKRDPARFAPFTEFMAHVMDTENDLTRADRELIAAHVSAINKCGYCVGSHEAALREMGAEPTMIEGGLKGVVDEPLRSRLLAFAGKLVHDPHSVSKADVDELIEAGWSEQAVEDTVCVVALFSFMNRLVDGYGITGNDKAFAQVGSALSQFGYGPIAKLLRSHAQRAA